MNDSLKQHVEEITDLPSLPAIAHEIIALTDDDLISVSKLERIIGNDPAISAKILSVANSVFYGSGTPAKTLHNSIMRIGFGSVRNIALGISIMTVLNDEKHQGTPDYARIFNHSVAVGIIAGLLSRRFKFTIMDEVVISGILHDLGLLIISRYFPDRYLGVLNAYQEGKTLLDAEKDIFNFNHTDIGSWLAVKWNLPGTISDTILYHHTPSLAKENMPHVAAVHIADCIADCNVIRSTSRDYFSPFDRSSLAILAMSEGDLSDVIHEVKSGSFFNNLFMA